MSDQTVADFPDAANAAGFGAAALPYAAGTVAPAAAATAAVAGLGAGTALTVAGMIEAMRRFARMRFASAEAYVYAQLVDRYPSTAASELRALVAQEARFEEAFRKKMSERLARDLPKAMEISDPSQRLAVLRALLEREKRFTLMREEAMLLRAMGRADALVLRSTSPQGAYWRLSDDVKEHTLECLAMGEKFWPWSVLENFMPPVHHGCQCYLLGLDTAVGRGLMLPDQVPDPREAEKRAKKVLKNAHDMMGEIPEDDLRRWMEEAWTAQRGDGNVVSLEERREPRRWARGFVKGGQFMPTRGGASAHTRDKLRDLLDVTPPAHGREKGRGKWGWVAGRYLRVPQDSLWERRIDGKTYTSPPGSTSVYQGGHEVTGSRRRSPGTVLKPTGLDLAEKLRAQMRAGQAEEIGHNVGARRSPISAGDPPSKVLALQDAGFVMESSRPTQGGTRLSYRHRDKGSTVAFTWDGSGITDVDWTPAPVVKMPGRPSKGAPGDFREFQADAISWADELGERFGADVHVPEVRIARRLGDHAGQHLWTGEAELGHDVAKDIERAGRQRAKGKQLRDFERRGVYASYHVTGHEIAHGVNPIEPDLFAIPAHANLEEALTEEISHVLAVERLEEQGQNDILDWRERNQSDHAVMGNYRHERKALADLLDSAGITEPMARRNALFALKFQTPPHARFDQLASWIAEAHPGEDVDRIRDGAELTMEHRSAMEGSVLPFQARSPGRSQVGTLGYGRFRDGWMGRDGRTFHTADGGFYRIEKIPFPGTEKEELEQMSDGTALAHYRAGEEPTDGWTLADGSNKSFRWVDNEDRARLILRAFTGKGSPGQSDAEDEEDAVARLGALPKNSWDWVAGVPVKRRYDGSYAVGWGVDDAKRLSPTLSTPRDAVELAMRRAAERPDWRDRSDRTAQYERAAGGPRSPGTSVTNERIRDAMLDWTDSDVTLRSMQDPRGYARFALVRDGVDVGSIILSARDANTVGIEWLGVGPSESFIKLLPGPGDDLRGTGFASRLVQAVIDRAGGMGATRVTSEADSPGSAKLFEKLGFAGGWQREYAIPQGPMSPGIGDIPDAAKDLLAKLMGHGPGLDDPEADKIIEDVVVATEAPKARIPKKPPDPLVGKPLGGTRSKPKVGTAIPNYEHETLTLGKSAGGTQGARWAFNDAGDRWLVKSYKGDEDRVATELLGNAVYRAVGAPAAEAGSIKYPTGNPDFSGVSVPHVEQPPLPETFKRISTGMVIVDDDGNVTIYSPKGQFGGYKNTFPKGGLEANLSPEQNAYKEVWEETGLLAQPLAFLGDFEGDTSVSRYYVARKIGGTPITTGKETEAVHTVPIAEARRMLNRERDHEILDALEKFGPVPQADMTPVEPGSLPETLQTALTYPTKEGKVRENFKPSAALGQHFMTDALVANWDFVGKTGDNVLWAEDGTPIRLDQGGTFELRAMGGTKPYGPIPTEAWTMLSKGQGKRGVKVTPEELKVQAAEIGEKLDDQTIDDLVNAAPFPDKEMKERVRENLKARVQWMRDFAADKVPFGPPTYEGEEARKLLDDEHGKISVFPEQEDALLGYAEGLDKDVTKVLHDKEAKLDDASKPVRKTVDELDSLLRHTKLPGDVVAYAGLAGSPEAARDLLDKTLQERAFMHGTLDPEEIDSPVVLRMMLPEGSHAYYTQAFHDEMPADPELLIARGAKLKVTKVTDRPDGTVMLDVTVATKPSYKSSGGWSGGKSGGSGSKPKWQGTMNDWTKGQQSFGGGGGFGGSKFGGGSQQKKPWEKE